MWISNRPKSIVKPDPMAVDLSASADYIVSGDKDLCDVGRYKSGRIIKVSELLRMID